MGAVPLSRRGQVSVYALILSCRGRLSSAALVLSACVQMPSLPAIDAVEHHSGLPTLSAATATTWAILRALILEPVAPGAGALLASAPERVA